VQDDVESLTRQSQRERFSQSMCSAGDEGQGSHGKIVIGKHGNR
jgi:hypothetical protein